MNDVKRIERELTAELRRRGVEITDVLKRQINAAAADAAMLERCRAAMNAGEAVDTDQYFQLRRAEEESRVALLGESAAERVDRIELEFIDKDGRTVPAREVGSTVKAENERLRTEIAALRLQLAAYQSGRNSSSPNGSETGAAVPPSAPDATPPPAAPSAPPSNVVPLAETREQRIARLRYEAGDRPQPLRGPFDDGYGRDFGLSGGATRFDNKVPIP